jgi:hypothetical protein
VGRLCSKRWPQWPQAVGDLESPSVHIRDAKENASAAAVTPIILLVATRLLLPNHRRAPRLSFPAVTSLLSSLPLPLEVAPPWKGRETEGPRPPASGRGQLRRRGVGMMEEASFGVEEEGLPAAGCAEDGSGAGGARACRCAVVVVELAALPSAESLTRPSVGTLGS